MNDHIKELAEQAAKDTSDGYPVTLEYSHKFAEKLAKLIIAECINEIETHQIPVGNSSAGEMACDWTYDALKQIRSEIKELYGLV